MTFAKRYAVLLVAIILALGLFAMPPGATAGANDDIELLRPPRGEGGDPDIPDGAWRVQLIGHQVLGRFVMGRFTVIVVPPRGDARMPVASTRNTRFGLQAAKRK